MKNKITLDLLNNSSPSEIIMKWEFRDSWNTNICWTDKILKWVAVRWVIWDFAIYYENPYSNESEYYPNVWEWLDTRIAEQWDKFPLSYLDFILEYKKWEEEQIKNLYRS